MSTSSLLLLFMVCMSIFSNFLRNLSICAHSSFAWLHLFLMHLLNVLYCRQFCCPSFIHSSISFVIHFFFHSCLCSPNVTLFAVITFSSQLVFQFPLWVYSMVLSLFLIKTADMLDLSFG